MVTQGLSITTFRCVPLDLRPAVGDAEVARYLDALNQNVLDRVQSGGEAFVSNAVVDSRFVLRGLHRQFPHDAGRRRAYGGSRGPPLP